MLNAYINIYNSMKNYKLDDYNIDMLPGAIISILLVIYCNLT